MIYLNSCKAAQYSAIVAALTTAVSAASFNQMAYDDILAMARQFADKPRMSHQHTPFIEGGPLLTERIVQVWPRAGGGGGGAGGGAGAGARGGPSATRAA